MKKAFCSFVISVILGSLLSAQSYDSVDSLRAVLETTPNYKDQTEILNKLTNLYFSVSLQEAYSSAKEIVKISQDNNYPEGLAMGLMQLGRAYALLGSYSEAFDSFLQAKNIYYELGSITNEGSAINAMANVLFMNENYEQALIYYRQSLEIKSQTNDSIGVAVAYSNMGEAFLKLNMLDSARVYCEKGIEAERKLGNEHGLAVSQSALAYIMYLSGRTDEALSAYFEANEIFYKHNDLYNIIYNYLDIAQIYTDIEELEKALQYTSKGLQYAREMEAARPIIAFLKLYADYYEITGNLEQSLAYYKQYSNLKDSILNQDRSKQIAELQTLYEMETKDREILLLSKENALSRTLVTLVSTVLLFAVLMLFLIFRQYRLKKRTANLLEAKNVEIEAQKTEIVAQNEQLEHHTKQLQKADKMKSRFFANISHEFRTPLTLILGPAENLMTELTQARQLNDLKLIKRNSEKLLGLINQILVLSEIENDAFRINPKPLDADNFFRRIYSLFTGYADEKEIRFEYHSSKTVKCLRADEKSLEIMVSNLLTNAFKFTPPKGRVGLNLTTDNDYLYLAVEDSGKGIQPNEKEMIFKRFYRSKHAGSAEGNGIGLALVKELADMHEANITVQSTPDKGSIFTVAFPLTNASESNAENQSPDDCAEIFVQETSTQTGFEQTEKKQPVYGKKLLIAEDNREMLDYLASHLQEAYAVYLAENGEQALTMLDDIEPDLIISDVMMPETDGFELTNYLKNDDRYSHIPVILLTARNRPDDMLTGYTHKADDYITKPFSMKVLKARISNLIELRDIMRKRFEKQLVVNPSEITASSADEQFLNKALKIVEENMDNSEFTTEMFCKELGMSRANVHRKIKALTNLSSSEFIRELRLKRAAQLLRHKSGNISEIAYNVGFNNLSYFSKCFKRTFGVSPTEYGLNS